MKKTEQGLLVLAAVGAVLLLLKVAGGAFITIISLSSLAVIYFYLGFVLFNGVRLRKMFKKDTYSGIALMKIILSAVSGLALSLLAVGILFGREVHLI